MSISNSYQASETFAMPFGVERDDGLVHNGVGATLAARRELVGVAGWAVGAARLELLHTNGLIY